MGTLIHFLKFHGMISLCLYSFHKFWILWFAKLLGGYLLVTLSTSIWVHGFCMSWYDSDIWTFTYCLALMTQEAMSQHLFYPMHDAIVDTSFSLRHCPHVSMKSSIALYRSYSKILIFFSICRFCVFVLLFLFLFSVSYFIISLCLSLPFSLKMICWFGAIGQNWPYHGW